MFKQLSITEYFHKYLTSVEIEYVRKQISKNIDAVGYMNKSSKSWSRSILDNIITTNNRAIPRTFKYIWYQIKISPIIKTLTKKELCKQYFEEHKLLDSKGEFVIND